jgi:hypothetical protein
MTNNKQQTLTPKEMAKELITAFYQPIFDIDCGSNVLQDSKRYEASRQCAIIHINQILNVKSIDKDYDLSTYYEEVKQEIENYDKQ